MRIGIFGGSFDPPHSGHLRLALTAMEHLELEEVVFVPAAQNPLKRHRSSANGRHRFAMLQELVKNRQGFSVSDVEVARGGRSYTVETVEDFKQIQPGDYWFLMGADSLKGLPGWKQPERLVKLCRLGVAIRPPFQPSEVIARLPDYARDRVDLIPMPPLEISSTQIRDLLAAGKSAAAWLDPGVLRYIQAHGLYKNV